MAYDVANTFHANTKASSSMWIKFESFHLSTEAIYIWTSKITQGCRGEADLEVA